jgi:hypothetical protein
MAKKIFGRKFLEKRKSRKAADTGEDTGEDRSPKASSHSPSLEAISHSQPASQQPQPQQPQQPQPQPSPFAPLSETLTDLVAAVCSCELDLEPCGTIMSSRSNLHHDEGDDDDSGDDSFNSEDLDSMLENMDIDKDFNNWQSVSCLFVTPSLF